MIRSLFLAVTLLCCSMWAIAQNSPDQSGASDKATKIHSGTKPTTIRGCLTNSGESYTITDSSGTQYLLTGDTADLSAHVNHQVAVKGTVSGTQGTGSATAAGNAEAFQVSKVTKISDSCSAGK